MQISINSRTRPSGRAISEKRQLIAIIDDDRPFRIALLELVRQLGFDARAFASADDFVAVDDEAFDCVVTDIQMPGMRGFDLARMLKSRDQPIPVILITASRADDDAGVVYIIDDDVSLCVALKELFNSIGLIAETHGSAREFLNGDLIDLPACIVIDVRLPDVNGLQFQNQLVQMSIRIPVVIMTGHGDILMSVRAMKAGAVDFLAKPFSHQTLLDAVLSALERDRQRRVNEQSAAQIKKQFETLSPRERQVMLLVTAGKMNKQVAGELGISEFTTKIHRASGTRKMGAHTFAELVRMADALNLLDP